MPNDVYNLGRATGLSAWEVYVRQSLLLNPDIEPLSEREWLSETIGLGDSMLLRITTDNTDSVHYREYQLPTNSLLGAPRTIIGSFFYGEGNTTTSGWCTKVTDYGPEISNTKDSSPVDGSQTAHSLPSNIADVSSTMRRRMMQYIKIQDAVILQDGIWSDSGTESPKKTFVPDITKPPVLRITFRSQVTEPFFLLLTGFVNRAIIKGEVGFDMGSVIPDDPADASAFRPENGDFLGPTLYPWANKVIFTYPGVLTSLLRDGAKSTSKNIKITKNVDSTDTTIESSPITAGPGVQVDDASTLADPAKTITVSSRIQSVNNYIQIQRQDQYNTTDGSSRVPTSLRGSQAQPGEGVGITQPTSAGEPHIISSKIEIDKSGNGSRFFNVIQRASNDANEPTTTIIPSYPTPGQGIAIGTPSSPGQPYTISSRIQTQGDGSNYIGVSQDNSSNPNDFTTRLTPSRAVPGPGVGFSDPQNAGDSHVISAIVATEGCGKNYLGVTQAENNSRSAKDVSTTLIPSKIASTKGISITQPDSPGGDVTIGAIIESGNNYLKVEQEAHDTGCGCGCGDGKGADTPATRLTASTIKTREGSRMTINEPVEPGGDIVIGTNIKFTPHLGISILDNNPDEGGGSTTRIGSTAAVGGPGAMGLHVEQASILLTADDEPVTLDNAANKFYISPLVVDDRNRSTPRDPNELKKETLTAPTNNDDDILQIIYGASPGDPIKFYINVDEIIKKLLQSGPLKNFMDSILNKIFGGGTVGEDGNIIWPEASKDIKIPLCDLNIYSNGGQGEVYQNSLRSRAGNTTNDLQMQ